MIPVAFLATEGRGRKRRGTQALSSAAYSSSSWSSDRVLGPLV